MDAKAHATKLLQIARKNMRRKGRVSEVTVTLEDITARIERGYCEVTGVEFELLNPYPRTARRRRRPSDPLAPSLDRIDSEDEDYSPENVQLVTNFYNNAKGEQLSNEETLQLMCAHTKTLSDRAKPADVIHQPDIFRLEEAVTDDRQNETL